VDKERRDSARGLQLLEGVGSTSTEDPAIARDRRLQEAEQRLDDLMRVLESAAAPPAAGSPPPRAAPSRSAASPTRTSTRTPAPAGQAKRVTRAEVRAVAKRLNITEAEAERQAKAEGYVVVP
jgi:hypothetical protein